MLPAINKKLNNIFYFQKDYYWTDLLGLIRSLLALATLLTLLFNNTDILFIEGVGVENVPLCVGPAQMSLYCLVNPYLEIGRWLSILVLIIVIIGWRPRVTCILHWWVTFSFNSTSLMVDGGDQVSTILTFLIIPICLLDKRQFHWQNYNSRDISFLEAKSWVVIVTHTIIRIQISYIYFEAAISKFRVDEWLNGTAVYYWFLDPYMGAPNWLKVILTPLLSNKYFVTSITWGTLVFESILFMSIFMTYQRRQPLLFLGLGFHFMIFLIHGLLPFFLSMSAALLLYITPLSYNIHTTFKKPSIFNFN